MTLDWLFSALEKWPLVVFSGFTLWAIVKISRFFGPKFTTLFERLYLLVETLRESNVKTTDFMERQTDMMSSILARLDVHEGYLNSIAEHVRVPLPKPGKQGRHTITPALEVSETGTVRPVAIVGDSSDEIHIATGSHQELEQHK